MTYKRTLTRTALAIAAMGTVTMSSAAVLEEIVVTAQKRTESLQDVPISITTIDGAKIEAAGIANLEDLTNFVPNLQLTENAVATSIIMRGVGPGANQSFEQSVGLYVDGIHLGKGRQSRMGFFDLERVEVLRGPQGILFGKNTLAGAINVTSATPRVGDETGGKISLTTESNDGTIVEGNIHGSVTDNLAMRFAFRDQQNDGYLPNTLIGTEGPTVDEQVWRFSATWEPNDETTVEFKHAEGEHVRVGGTAVVNVVDPVANLGAASRLAFGVVGAFFPQVAANANNGVLDYYRDSISLGGSALAASLGRDPGVGEKPEGTDTDNSETSLKIDRDFGDGFEFTSVTGLSEYQYEDGIDADFLPIQFIGRSDISEYDHFSQEFRIASDATKRFSYIAGAYYEDGTQEIDRVVAFDGTLGLPAPVMTALIGAPTLLVVPPAVTGALGIPFGLNGVTSFKQAGRVSNWKQDTESWAVFFQGEYEINDNWKLTAGLRYTEEDKDATGSLRITTDTTGLATHNPSPLLAAVLRGVAPTTYDHSYVDSRTTDQWTPGVTLEWTQSDDNLFYLSYSEGFKSGGFNSVDDQAPDLARDRGPVFTVPGDGWSYDDETANSLELGGKHTLADGSMNLNWALFTSEYENQQVSTFVGIGFQVRNAASSDVNGLELDWRWQATDNLQIGANLALLDATYGAFPSAGCTAIQQSAILGGATSFDGCVSRIGPDGNAVANQDLKGAQLANAPDYSGSVFVDYSNNLTNDTTWFVSADVNFTDGYFLAGDIDPVDFQAGFEKVNLRAGVRGENWELMVFGRNVTDELTASGGFDVPLLSGGHAIYTDPGEIYGIRGTLNF